MNFELQLSDPVRSPLAAGVLQVAADLLKLGGGQLRDDLVVP